MDIGWGDFMRVSPKRWANSEFSDQPEVRDHDLLLMSGGLVEVVRLGAGEPIVMVPGLAGGWKLLAPLAHRLAQRYEVFLYSLRGDRAPLVGPPGCRLGAYADDLLALIERLRLERPTVLGVSFGGAIALELAVEHPERVGALILQGVEARFQPTLGSTIAKHVLERFPLPSDNLFVNQFFNLLHGCKPEPGALVDFVVERCWETDQSVMARRLEMLESFDVSDRLWRLDMPTLVMAGTRDVIVRPERQRALATEIPGARFAALDGAGHIGFLTHPTAVTHQVKQLLRSRRRSLC
jgi:pimeloyl-ACP methyl ester carboxylesterase